MPVHIEDLVSEVAVWDGDLVLSDKQLEIIVHKVIRRLEGSERSNERSAALTALRTRAQPPVRSRG